MSVYSLVMGLCGALKGEDATTAARPEYDI